MNSLKSLKPTQVSKDLKGKYILIYGAPKIGKTTLAVQFPKNVLFAVEKGYNAINGIYAVDIPTWKDFKLKVKELDDPEVKEMFNTVTIDTVSLLYEKCTDYICNQQGVDKIGDIDYGAGYGMVDKEFENGLRAIQYMGYGLVLICHEKARVDTDGQNSVKHIVPDLSDRCSKIVNRLVDMTSYIGMEDKKRYIYPRQTIIDEGKQRTEIYAGSHFAGLNDKIELGYENLVNAVSAAMDQTATENNYKMIDTPVEIKQEEKIDLKATQREIGSLFKILKALDETMDDPCHVAAYKAIVEKYLGKGKLVRDCDESQADHVYLILNDMKEYFEKNNIKEK